jgi:thiosulfate dehydrogenase
VLETGSVLRRAAARVGERGRRRRDDAPGAEGGAAADDPRRESAHQDERLSPAKAQQVADLLVDLMRCCNAELVARIARDEVITLSVDGLPFEHDVPGGPVPVQLVHGTAVHTPREQAIWKAELDKLVAEGDRLFHSDEIGTNGVACAMCHPNASNKHPETYPKLRTQLEKVALLRDMVNWCIINPLEGKELAEDDPKLRRSRPTSSTRARAPRSRSGSTSWRRCA